MTSNGTSADLASTRIDWVDYAKGICIVMVVMMHSVLGVEMAAGDTGFMHAVVMFAKPFRMPDFFLISGLFLSRRHRPRLAHLSRPQGRALRLFLRAVDDDPVRLQGARLRRRAGLGPCRLAVSGILHRAVRHAVVHLSAADFLRCHKTDTRHPRHCGLGRRCGARERACRDRLDRDRRVLRALRLHLFRLSVRLLRLRAVGSSPGKTCAGADRIGAVGDRQWRPRDRRASATGR